MRSTSSLLPGPFRALVAILATIAGVASAAPNYQGLWWSSPP